MAALEMEVNKKPRGFLRPLFRFPILFYKLGLGWIFGKRFLMLTHIGRNSGHLHNVVLEVLYHNRVTTEYYVLSGWGANSNWCKNILKNPEVIVNVDGHKFEALAIQVSFDEATKLIFEYTKKHPRAFQMISKRVLGFEVSGNKDDIEMLAKSLPVIRLQPL